MMKGRLGHSVKTIWTRNFEDKLDETAEYKQRDGAISNHT